MLIMCDVFVCLYAKTRASKCNLVCKHCRKLASMTRYCSNSPALYIYSRKHVLYIDARNIEQYRVMMRRAARNEKSGELKCPSPHKTCFKPLHGHAYDHIYMNKASWFKWSCVIIFNHELLCMVTHDHTWSYIFNVCGWYVILYVYYITQYII